MNTPTSFEWDEDKAALNVLGHNVSFEFAKAVFLDPERVDLDVSREEDGEARRKVIGYIGRRLFIIIYTVRDGACRLISARRTNRNEDRAYGNR